MKTRIFLAFLVLIAICLQVHTQQLGLNCSGGQLNCNPPLATSLGGTSVTSVGASGLYLKSNGTNFILSTNSAAGTGACTNQVVRVENADAAPTCATITSAFIDGSVLPSASPTFTGTLGGPTVNATTGFQINGVAVSTAWVTSNTAASSTISGTSAKTYLSLNAAIPANLLTAGKTITVDARGVYNGNATDTIITTLEACQVSGCGSGAVVQIGTASAITMLGVTNDLWQQNTQTVVYTGGASGTLDTQGTLGVMTAGTTLVQSQLPNTATQTINLTVLEYLSLSVKFSTNSGNDSFTLRNLKVIIQ